VGAGAKNGAMNLPQPAHGRVDPSLVAQLREAIRVGADMTHSVLTLRNSGYSDEAILEALNELAPRGDALEQGVMTPPLLRRAPAKLRKVDTDEAQIYTLEDAMSPNDCSRLIGLINHHLRPSTLSYPSPDRAFRTSQTADLCFLKSPVATGMDEKICKTIGIRPQYAEGIQAQRYDVGQQFKAHWDYYEPDTQAFVKYAGVRGNRTWTFMVYLNDGMEGGATRFTKLDFAVQPKAGMAVIWNNLKEDGSPNPATMHCGEPVTSGFKLIITKWFRMYGDGPLFY
jgi:prolyl 4-hydroxylase